MVGTHRRWFLRVFSTSCAWRLYEVVLGKECLTPIMLEEVESTLSNASQRIEWLKKQLL